MPTNTSESGLEALITKSLVDEAEFVQGDPKDYDREHAVDLRHLADFLTASQDEAAEQLKIASDHSARQKFLHRLQGEIASRGVIDVLRNGVEHDNLKVSLYYGIPTAGNETATRQHASNVFSVTRQLRYSRDKTQLSLDMAIFINGLPVATFELKNSLTKQTYADAITQYKTDRDPRELLFQFGRCMVHFAVDDQQVWMCTHLKGKNSWFLPFNKGDNDGAGNPVNPNGLKTDYLWKQILTKSSLCNIVESYAQVIEEEDDQKRKKKKQIFPRFHQLDCVRKLLADASEKGAGQKYLIQHSAGSGKSNSITWLTHQLVDLARDGAPVFDSTIVVTDRVNLDKQLRENIKQFAQVSVVIGVAKRSGDLRKFIQQGKKIIITTVQKFPFVLEDIGNDHRDRTFALVIDEAHSSQGGRTMAAANIALSQEEQPEEETPEDRIARIIKQRKMLPNASYFAFTATPKNKTLELFGEDFLVKSSDGDKTQYRPFHGYTMKQAVQEGFIQDVLQSYTPVDSWYRLVKTIEDDPTFDSKKAQRKLRLYVESHDHAICRKAEIMVDHFHDQVVAKKKLDGKARAMVVTSGIQRAMQYKTAFDAYLEERKSPFKAIVAFSGDDHEYLGQKNVSEATMNGFPGAQIEATFKTHPYRFLIVADKFQTGYDEPLLHTMYVDKALSGVKAVQTLSRLNRAHPKKHDTFVLDFQNDTETIQGAFEDYYRTTVLSDKTDPNKLHDLKRDLDERQVYTWPEVQTLVDLYLGGAERDELDPILDLCVARYNELDEDGQVDFKGKAKAFTRTYSFLAAVLPWASPNWERLSTFLNFLIPKLPAPVEEDLSRGVLETIDMDSYRVEVQAQLQIVLPDQQGELDPIPVGGGGGKPEPELDKLSNIIRAFNDQWGNIEWEDPDMARRLITEDIPEKVSDDEAYRNAVENSDRNAARMEHDRALHRVMMALIKDHTVFFKHYSDNESFRHWLQETNFSQTYEDSNDRLTPAYELLLSHYQKAAGANVTGEWNKHAAVFQRGVNNIASLKEWVAAARGLVVGEMPLVPSAFGNMDVATVLRIVDDRLQRRRTPRYVIERSVSRGAGIRSLDQIEDDEANRVQDWLVKQLHVAFSESASSRQGKPVDEWRNSLTKNAWTGLAEQRLQQQAGEFQASHDRLVGPPDGWFRESARTEMAKCIGKIQHPISDGVVESDVVWRHLFEFGEAITKVTSESLAERDGLKGVELLNAFKQSIGKPATAALNTLFRLRCRGDHADDVSKRGEWEQTQHEVARLLGRNKPKFSGEESGLLFRPDDLALTPVEGNEVVTLLLTTVTSGFAENSSDNH